MSDPWEMALIHRLIRRGFEQAREFVMAVPVGATDRVAAVAEYVEFHLDGLHAHHSSEDELIWPALHERANLSDALITRMEDQHARVHAAIERPGAPGTVGSSSHCRIVGGAGQRGRHHRRSARGAPGRGGARRRSRHRHPHHSGRHLWVANAGGPLTELPLDGPPPAGPAIRGGVNTRTRAVTVPPPDGSCGHGRAAISWQRNGPAGLSGVNGWPDVIFGPRLRLDRPAGIARGGLGLGHL
jgi:hypothetical protein